jgi:hypothetical protein
VAAGGGTCAPIKKAACIDRHKIIPFLLFPNFALENILF